ncbi:MAG: DUF3570 domain-containing protein [Terrimonas sp.]|nr:DUF3570 domain-containing protein [Terrimonas sp.]
MRKICLTVIGMCILLVHAFSQSPSSTDPEAYKSLDLKLEETNLVTSYYSQNGNHSPVTGGIGTQKLTDISNIINLKFVKWDIFDRKHTFHVELGIDHHTAASSAYVSKTGASKTGGTRIYPSVNWQVENEAKRTTFGVGASYSNEYTYHSYGANILFAKHSKDNNREFTAKGNIFLDQVKMVQPSELRPEPVVVSSASRAGDANKIPSSPRNTFATSFSLSQVVNKRFQVSVIADAVAQQGYLGLPFHRVYFKNITTEKVEKLPASRFKLPLGIRLNYFAGDKVILRSYYRYYTDNWGVTAHTASLEVPVKITPFVSVSPFYRYYVQTAAKYFAPIYAHDLNDVYFTSNYDYSAFHSQFAGINFRVAPPKGVFGVKNFSLLEIRYGHYHQTTGLNANNISLNIRFK